MQTKEKEKSGPCIELPALEYFVWRDWGGSGVTMCELHSLGCWATKLPANDHPFFNKQD